MKNGSMLAKMCVITLALVSVLLVIGIAASLYRLSSAQAARPQGFITVSASGFAYALPSQAVISITANGTGQTAQEAVANMSEGIALLNSTLYSYLGANTSLVSTSSYYVYKTYNRSTYTAVESVSATIPDVSNVNALLLKLSAISGVYVDGIDAQLSSGQITQLRGQALQSAMLNATEQAEALVSPMQVRLANVSISNYVIYPVYASASGGPAVMPDRNVTPTFYPGTSKVTESLNAVFSYG